MTNMEDMSNITMASLWKIGVLELCMLSLNSVTGIPTNVYVLWLLVSDTVAGEIFNIGLCVCGTLFSVNSILTIVSNYTTARGLAEMVWFFLGFAITGLPLFQCLMCVERFLAVVHPLTFLKLKPLRYRIYCFALAWMIIFTSCLCSLLSCLFNVTTVFLWFYIVQLVLYFSIQLFCLVSVLRALKQSGPGERKEESHRKRRAFHIILVTTVSMFFTYLPFTITGLYSAVTGGSVQILWSLSYIFFMLAGWLSPLLILQRNGKLSCHRSPTRKKH